MFNKLLKISNILDDNDIQTFNKTKQLQNMLNHCKNIRYGVYDYQNVPNYFYTNDDLTDEVFYTKWRFLNNNQIQNYNAAICWDMSNYLKIILNKNNIKNVQIYCELNNKEKASHSFNIAKINDYYYILDGAWKCYSNLNFSSKNINDCIKQMAKRMFDQHKYGSKISFYQIIKTAPYGCDCQEYMENIYTNNKFLITYQRYK